MTQTITLPGYLPPTINALMFGTVNNRIVTTRVCKSYVAAYALEQGIAKATGKRRVTLKLTLAGRHRTRDADSSHKAILDALVTAGLLLGDDPDSCETPPLEQVRGEAIKTEIVLEDLP